MRLCYLLLLLLLGRSAVALPTFAFPVENHGGTRITRQTTYYPGMGTSQEESGRVILESELVLKESSTAGADEDRMSW